MPKLFGPPDPIVVASLKGTLDFYYWRGIPVCRTWPRASRFPQTAPSLAAATDFGDTATALSQIPLEFVVAAQEITKGTRWTWRDLWTAAIYGGLWYEENSVVPAEAPEMLPHISGRYYTAPMADTALTTISDATGSIRAIPFCVPTNGQYSEISWEVTATTGGNDRVAIYGPVTGLPGSAPLVYDSGNVAIGSTGVKAVSISLVLEAGWYLLALQNSVTRTHRGLAVASILDQLGYASAGNQRQGLFVTLAQAFGAFPLSLGNSAAYAVNTIAPAIWLKLA